MRSQDMTVGSTLGHEGRRTKLYGNNLTRWKSVSNVAKDVVDTVLRSLRILETLSARPGGAGVTELAVQEGVNKALVFRALASLVEGGWVVQDSASDKYQLSGTILRVAGRYYKGIGLNPIAASKLRPLADRTGCQVEFTRYFDGAPRVLIAIGPSHSPTGFQTVTHVGDRQSPHATAAGKVWLASLPDDQLSAYLQDYNFERFTSRTITDRDAMMEEIQQVRQQGFAYNDGEELEALFAVAVPVWHGWKEGALAGAIGLSSLQMGMGEEERKAATAAAQEKARELAEMLPTGDYLPR